MENITKEQFLKFVALRKSGRLNMTDVIRGSRLINETEDVYETILWNYARLEEKFL